MTLPPSTCLAQPDARGSFIPSLYVTVTSSGPSRTSTTGVPINIDWQLATTQNSLNSVLSPLFSAMCRAFCCAWAPVMAARSAVATHGAAAEYGQKRTFVPPSNANSAGERAVRGVGHRSRNKREIDHVTEFSIAIACSVGDPNRNWNVAKVFDLLRAYYQSPALHGFRAALRPRQHHIFPHRNRDRWRCIDNFSFGNTL